MYRTMVIEANRWESFIIDIYFFRGIYLKIGET